jgi:hypothetical protein
MAASARPPGYGYFSGGHCQGPSAGSLTRRRFVVRIPYPAVFRTGSRPDRFVLRVDIAPTMLELAGATSPRMQGRLQCSGQPRDAVMIEYFGDTVFPRIRKMGYRAVAG